MSMRTLALCLLLLLPLVGQQARLRLDLPALAARAAEVSEVTLDGAALKLGMAFLDNDQEMNRLDRQALSQLQGIYVKTFEFDTEHAVSDADLAPIRQQLQAAGWTRLVSVQSKRHGRASEDDEVYLCTGRDGVIQGMAIISREARELDLVNIVGPIQPSQLSALGGHLGIPELDMKPAGKGRP